MKYLCPICSNKLVKQKINKLTTDFKCSKLHNHFYAERIKSDKIIKMKVRFTEEDNSKLYLLLDLEESSTKVWTNSDSDQVNPDKITINQSFTPDFSNIAKLKSKIRLFLIMS